MHKDISTSNERAPKQEAPKNRYDMKISSRDSRAAPDMQRSLLRKGVACSDLTRRHSEKGEVLPRGVGTLRDLFAPSASAQWQPDGLTIHTKKRFLGAGFLGAPPISLIRPACICIGSGWLPWPRFPASLHGQPVGNPLKVSSRRRGERQRRGPGPPAK